MPHLWILEDDEDAVALYQTMFHPLYQVQTFATLEALRSALSTDPEPPDLLIADIHLPDGTFDEFLSTLSSPMPMPFAVVSAQDDTTVLKNCFDRGARDFFVKPINPNEVLFKVQKMISGSDQRSQNLQSSKFYELTLDLFAQSVSRNGLGNRVTLTQTECKILALLFRTQGRRLQREEIIQEVWRNEVLSPKAFDFHLSKLREKLKEIRARIHFRSSEGYCLIQE